MIDVKKPRWLRRDDSSEDALAFDHRQAEQAPAFQPEAVEGIEVRLGAAVEQVSNRPDRHAPRAHDVRHGPRSANTVPERPGPWPTVTTATTLDRARALPV